MTDELERRAALHAALGEPARLAIVDDLAVSDRSPKELGERHGLPTNLLAHHLDVLEAAGLIVRFGSAGDRRRKYVRLIAAPLTWLAKSELRPGGNVLFLCSHNSARSQLAAALWTARTGQPADSAGTHPAARVHRGAVAAARRAGLDLSSAVPRHVDEIGPNAQVVTVCDRAHEELEPNPTWWHWSIPDPVEAGTAAAFDAVVADLDARIRTIVPVA
jgi:protein-tyrosine-phosphatase/DNA-binding transcriptional ArsR family regulator